MDEGNIFFSFLVFSSKKECVVCGFSPTVFVAWFLRVFFFFSATFTVNATVNAHTGTGLQNFKLREGLSRNEGYALEDGHEKCTWYGSGTRYQVHSFLRRCILRPGQL